LPGLHGRQLDRAGAPARGGRKKAFGCQAIGRSRGGPSTKLHAIVEARGLPVEVVVTPGQVSDYGPAEALIEGRAGEAVIADRGYDADRVIDLIERQGSEAVIPPRKHRRTKPRVFARRSTASATGSSSSSTG
jgi:transposase